MDIYIIKEVTPFKMKTILCFWLIFTFPFFAYADVLCKGHFVNPVTDICWGCVLPISIGSLSIGKGVKPKKRDSKNPSSPICACRKNGIVIPGISIGFWEPVRLIDVTRTAYCMTNLGGISIGNSYYKTGGYNQSYDRRGSKASFYHVHYYVYPLIYWLELITDFMCLEQSSFDIAYLSELDITWNDPKMQALLNPEAILFGNPAAQAACALDCTSSVVSMPQNSLFWCAGCYGNLYPFSGTNVDHVGGIQNSSLLATRILAKMHRMGLAQETSTSSSRINGPICRKSRILKIKKDQYKLQLVNPKSTADSIGCWPIGLSDMLYSSFKEYPYDGQDFGYLLWRKKNCCLF